MVRPSAKQIWLLGLAGGLAAFYVALTSPVPHGLRRAASYLSGRSTAHYVYELFDERGPG